MAASFADEVGIQNDVEVNTECPVVSKDLINIKSGTSCNFERKLLLGSTTRDDLKPRKTFRVPESSILSQVRSFLPAMAEAQKDLEQKMKSSPDDVDIENIDNCDSVIEMNLALVEQSDNSDNESDSDLSSLSETENEIAIGDMPVTEENFKITKNSSTKKACIEEVTNDETI